MQATGCSALQLRVVSPIAGLLAKSSASWSADCRSCARYRVAKLRGGGVDEHLRYQDRVVHVKKLVEALGHDLKRTCTVAQPRLHERDITGAMPFLTKPLNASLRVK